MLSIYFSWLVSTLWSCKDTDTEEERDALLLKHIKGCMAGIVRPGWIEFYW